MRALSTTNQRASRAAGARGCRAPARGPAAPSLRSRRPSRRQHVSAGKGQSEFDIDNAPAPDQTSPDDLGPREDDILPDSLADAVAGAAAATAAAINSGSTRCQVEILLPEFWDPISGPIFPNKGDQERFWRMTRRFVEQLGEATKSESVKAIYPDAGVAAMLSYQWQDRSFAIDSLNARRPVAAEDALLVVACPDPPGADDCRRVVRQAGEQDEAAGVPERPIVLFNQRLSSGDVGIGLNARRLRESFLQQFAVTYSLRPIGDVGTVFRAYPGLWKVFVEEPDLPGRYKLVAEQPRRPAGEALEQLIDQALGRAPAAGEDGAPAGGAAGLAGSIRSTMSSMQRFMRSLSQ